MATEYTPQSKADVEEMVRHGLTGYTDQSKLSQDDFDAVYDLAQLRLSNRTGSTDWFVDDGLGQALVFGTAILAKARVENYTVSNYSFGDINLDVRGAGETDTLQLQQWVEAVARGIESAKNTIDSADRLRNTTDYIG